MAAATAAVVLGCCLVAQGVLLLLMYYKPLWSVDAVASVSYVKEKNMAVLKEQNVPIHKMVICGGETTSTIPNRILFPGRFMKDPQFQAFRNDLEANKALVKNNFIIFGNRSKSSKNFSVYYHVHKSGGTTMEHLAATIKPHLETEDLNWETEGKIGKTAFDRRVSDLLGDIHHRQNATLFTFVRDPVPRFLSALSQLLSMPQRHFKLSPCHKKTKRSSDAQQLIQCVLHKIMNGNLSRNYLDPHFMPQLYELYSAVQHREDIGILLFSLSSMDAFQKSCSTSSSNISAGTTNGTTTATRYRVMERLPGFPSLAMDQALTPDLIRQICNLYRMDVILLEALQGLVPSLCSNQSHRS
eukprot:scaffold2708_cov119-Cylindrotheca_fusiformis.AAC.7